MFVAVHRDTGRRCCTVGCLDPRSEIPDWDKYCCPITGSAVTPVKESTHVYPTGTEYTVRSHWRTLGRPELDWPPDLFPDTDYHTPPKESGKVRLRESNFHLAGKIYAAENAHKFNAYCTSDLCEYELKIEIPGTGKKRIADVAFVFPMGGIVVFEVQVSPISTKDLIKRTEDYLDSGVVSVYWFVNAKNISPSLQLEYYERFGEYLYLMQEQ